MSRIHRPLSLFCLIVLVTVSTNAVPSPVKLKVAITPFISNAVFQIAQDEWYFREQGLDVELVAARGATDLLPMLLRGDVDVVAPGFSAALFRVLTTGAAKVVLPLTLTTVKPETSFAFVARKSDAQSGRFAVPASWRGARVALPGGSVPTGAMGYGLAMALQRGSLTMKDVSIVPLDTAVQAEALATGQLDIAAVAEPWLTRMLARGDLEVLLPLEPLIPDFVYSVIVYGRRLMTDRDAGVRFAAAFIKALKQYDLGKTPRNVAIATKLTGLDQALVKKMGWADVHPDGRIDPKSLQAFQSWLVAQGDLDAVLDPAVYLDPSYAREANRLVGAWMP